MTTQVNVTLPGAMQTAMMRHLFPSAGGKHGAVIAVGVNAANGETRLVGQRLFIARDGIDYDCGERGYRRLRAEFIAECIAYCSEQRLGYLAVHNHGGSNRVAFSGIDLESHERGYPALLDILDGPPVGALVFATHACAGDIWFSNGDRRSVRETRTVDTSVERLWPAPSEASDEISAGFDRQVLMFGDAGQAQLQNTKVAIIGLGGIGSLLVEYLARLGVGHLVLIDPDRVQRSNLPRLVGATRWDARWPFDGDHSPRWLHQLALACSSKKTTVAARLARAAQAGIRITSIDRSLARDSVARRCLDSDFLFLAADSMQARLVFNAMVHQYLIPGIQLGSKIVLEPESCRLRDAYSVVRWVLPGFGCLWCNGLISPHGLALESKPLLERLAQDYGTRLPAPSVITLNAIAASVAANEFLTSQLGLLRAGVTAGWQRFHHLSREVLFDLPRKNDHCPECGSHAAGRYGKGDSRALPTILS